MTDEVTTETEVTVYNPYPTHEWDASRAWVRGQHDRNGTPPIVNPFDAGSVQSQAWSQGMGNLGVIPSEFNAFIPDPTDGTFIYTSIMVGKDTDGDYSSAQPHIVWGYDRASDEREDKLFPRWASLPELHRSMPMHWNWASIMAKRVISSSKMEGVIELPCPPYEYTADGSQLTIRAGAFTKSGSKQEWESVLEEMQSEVEDLPDGQDVGDEYVDVDLTITYTHTVSIAVSSLLPLEDDTTFIGTFDEFEEDIRNAIDSYDYEYEVEQGGMEYPDITADDFNTDSISGW